MFLLEKKSRDEDKTSRAVWQETQRLETWKVAPKIGAIVRQCDILMSDDIKTLKSNKRIVPVHRTCSGRRRKHVIFFAV